MQENHLGYCCMAFCAFAEKISLLVAGQRCRFMYPAHPRTSSHCLLAQRQLEEGHPTSPQTSFFSKDFAFTVHRTQLRLRQRAALPCISKGSSHWISKSQKALLTITYWTPVGGSPASVLFKSDADLGFNTSRRPKTGRRIDHEQCRSCGVIKLERSNKRAFSQAAIFWATCKAWAAHSVFATESWPRHVWQVKVLSVKSWSCGFNEIAFLDTSSGSITTRQRTTMGTFYDILIY